MAEQSKHKIVYSEGKFSASGVKEVREFTDTAVLCTLESGSMYLEGRELNVTSLDVSGGTLEVSGTITSVRYGNGGGKEGFFKRLFK